LKKLLPAAFTACLFLLVLGAKWAVFDRYGSPMPDWDQWDAEGSELFIPWLEKDEFLRHLFHPHNEHRVILTKLQNLALGLLNGQWDSRLEAASNAVLHAAIAAALWLLAWRWIGVPGAAPAAGRREISSDLPAGHAASRPPDRRRSFLATVLFLVCAALFGLPMAWQNTLGGFHSQQYWLLGLSMAAIVTLPFARTGSAAWWLGALAAILALGSMGSGLIASAVVLATLGWRVMRRDATLRAAWPTLALMAAVVAVGALTRVEPEWHQNLKATTVHDFFFSILHSLQWPLRDQHWAALVLWLPCGLVAWRMSRSRAGLGRTRLRGCDGVGGLHRREGLGRPGSFGGQLDRAHHGLCGYAISVTDVVIVGLDPIPCERTGNA